MVKKYIQSLTRCIGAQRGNIKMPLHEWTLDPKQAITIQKQLASSVEKEDRLPKSVKTIAGVDIGFEKAEDKIITRAVVVVLNYPALQVIDYALHKEPTRMPYIPGLLSFREVPAAINAFRQLKQKPDLIMVDGQGIAHPRRLGVASHLGLWLDKPTIGVAKKRLCGQYGFIEELKGSCTTLKDKDEVIGTVLRSKDHINPLYISIGHRISLETACYWVSACLTKYKLPEPTRQADRLASQRVTEKQILQEWQTSLN